MKYDYITIGAGIAGVTAVRSIRQHDKSGSVLLVDGEDRLPYKRTKISKTMATGFTTNAFALLSEDDLRGMNIFYQRMKINSIDLLNKTIRDQQGEILHWNKLLLCTGAEVVLPDFDDAAAKRIFPIRTAKDVEQLLGQLHGRKNVAVVGGGVLGVEVAEQIAKLGAEVSILFQGDRLMERHFDAHLSAQLKLEMQQAGIQLFPGKRIVAMNVSQSDVCELMFSSGESHLTDLVVSCIGTRPNFQLARQSGIQTSKGIQTDWEMRCYIPDVFAAGDTVELPDGRVEGLWHAAEYQGMIAGTNAAGGCLVHDRRGFRMKLETENSFYFSQFPRVIPENQLVWSSADGKKYYSLLFSANKLVGALMYNDAPNAKRLQQAIWEEWDLTTAKQSFFIENSKERV
jgi:NAD(P)H-nitrite reductase large subunit